MLSYNLDNFEAASRFLRMCEKYNDQMEIDLTWGRYTVNAFSILGVHSLIGHIVTVVPQTQDEDLIFLFERDLKEIS